MGRGSVGRRVSRAARTGGGRAYSRRNTPWSWWTTMGLIVLLGVVLVGWSRHQRMAVLTAAAHGTPPTLGDHWHEAFVFDLCGTLEPNPPQNPNYATAGEHTHGDGNIHIEPIGASDTGKNATLGHFVQLYAGMGLSSTSVQYPGLAAYHNGQKCGSKPGYVQVEVWDSPTAKTGHLVKGNPADLLLKNGQLVTIAFLPKGSKIPKPPAQNIANLQQNMSAAAGSTKMTLPKTVTTVPASTKPVTPGQSTTPTSKAP
ncbi:MAG TPA: hypothetical protein VFW24_09885 [Acidimicrobiales bacterium]|nr:hypothetical protein [Acidimicrobiales bacterium]